MSHEEPTDGNRSREQIANGLLAYLESRPDSMDTLEGIADSWLSNSTFVDRVLLAQVIDNLVASGKLERVVCKRAVKFRLTR